MCIASILRLAAALVIGGFSLEGTAASLQYHFERISDNSPELLGQQLSLEVEALPGGALFTFRNALGVRSSITDIYFDDRRRTLFSDIIYQADSGVGVSFDDHAAPVNLPGGQAAGFVASFSGDSNSRSLEQGVLTAGVPSNGVNRLGEWVSFLGFWAGATNFDGLLQALSQGDFRVGLHVQGIGSAGASDSYVNQPSAVPLPAAAWLFASALFGFVLMANRRKV